MCTCDLLFVDVTDSMPSLMRPECWSSKVSYTTQFHAEFKVCFRQCPTGRQVSAHLDPVGQEVCLDEVEPHVHFCILRVHIALLTFARTEAGRQCMTTRTASWHGVDSPACSHSARLGLHF